MKKVNKDFRNIPNPLDLPRCDVKISLSLKEKGSHKFSGSYYASDSIKKRLSKIYNNKCAFCENDTTSGASLQVEHYRPKAKITEDNNHPGYYWLGYQWSNLLFACSKCNRSKSNYFPIKSSGTRVSNPKLLNTGGLDKVKSQSTYSDYTNEFPLIINPEIINPRPHLSFLPSGKIKGITIEGESTIKICKLYRNPLVIARKKIISNVLYEFKKVINAYRLGNVPEATVKYVVSNEVSKLLVIINKNESFSELARTALLKFDYFFIRRFNNQYDRKMLKRYLNEIKLRL